VLHGGHDCAQVGHGFSVFVRVGDCRQRCGAAVVLGKGDNVGPLRVVAVGVFWWHGGRRVWDSRLERADEKVEERELGWNA